eukprot:3330119-Rhodomonas_salina.8
MTYVPANLSILSPLEVSGRVGHTLTYLQERASGKWAAANGDTGLEPQPHLSLMYELRKRVIWPVRRKLTSQDET